MAAVLFVVSGSRTPSCVFAVQPPCWALVATMSHWSAFGGCCIRYLLAKYSFELGQYVEAENALLKDTGLEVRLRDRVSCGSTHVPRTAAAATAATPSVVHTCIDLLLLPALLHRVDVSRHVSLVGP